MPKTTLLTFLSITMVLITSCKSSEKVVAISDYKKNMLVVSTGGGFTGAEAIFTILENGQVFSASGFTPEKVTALGQLNTKTVKSLFLKASKVNWASISINDPGNMFKTLSFGKNGEMIKHVWGGGNTVPSSDLTNLYEEINRLVTSIKK